MSYITVYGIRPDGEVVPLNRAVRCAPAFAPVVWAMMGMKYGVEPEFTPPLNVRGFADPYYGRNAIENIWPLLKDPRLPEADKLLLGCTYDAVWLKRERIPALVAAIEAFTADWVRPRGQVEAALEVARLMEFAPGICIGFCFNMTSVVASFWQFHTPLGKDGLPLIGNGKAYDYGLRPMNVFTDKTNGLPGSQRPWEIGEGW